MDTKKVAVALDLLALALTNHNHKWTDKERKSFDSAIRELGERPEFSKSRWAPYKLAKSSDDRQ